MRRDADEMFHQDLCQESDRGSMLLASVMTVTFGVLMFMGMVNSTLNERLRTDQVVRTARALQVAQAGTEYALWEINYGGNDFNTGNPAWQSPTANVFTYSPPLPCPAPLPPQACAVTVTVDKTTGNPSGSVWTITASGTSQAVTRRVAVRIPAGGGGAPAQPGLFDQLFYTAQSNIWIDARNGEVVLDGYDSNNNNNPIPGNQLIIMTDTTPSRKILWDTPGDALAGAVILEGNVTTNAQVVMRKLDLPDESLGVGWESPPGVWGFADKTTAPGSFTGTIAQADRISGIPFNPEVGPTVDPVTDYPIVPSVYSTNPDPYYSIDPSQNEIMVICPGETVKTTELDVTDITLVVGCTQDGGQYDCSNPNDKFHTIDGIPFTDPGFGHPGGQCGGDLTQPVTISAGTGSTTDKGPYAFSVNGTGQIRIVNPAKIYYNYPGTSGGFLLGGNGIDNQVKKNCGVSCETYDVSKLEIYGGGDASSPYPSTISTSQAFYGVIFDPQAEVTFSNTSLLNAYGSLNVRKISTASNVRLHWDKALPPLFPPPPSGGACAPPNCRPSPGSWSLTNY